MSVVVSWVKTSLRYVIIFLRISGLYMLLVKNEKAAGPIEIL